MKKPRTEKQLANDKRLAEAAKARREKVATNRAKNVTELPDEAPEQPRVPADDTPEPQTTYSDADIAELIKQVKELKAQNFAQPQNTLQSNNGRLIGTVTKYIVDPSHYPSPIDRLKNEPKLARFAFPLNYDLVFDVAVSSYETKDGINTREPRFTLQLVKIMLDEETGDPTNKRYMLYQMIFHEDPQAALILAQENGLDVNEGNEKQFLDEMRYLRMRDWLFQLTPFYPLPATSKKNRKEEVIGNRVVEVYEVSGESAQPIPMNELNKKF